MNLYKLTHEQLYVSDNYTKLATLLPTHGNNTNEYREKKKVMRAKKKRKSKEKKVYQRTQTKKTK
jgi:hypothetical protein